MSIRTFPSSVVRAGDALPLTTMSAGDVCVCVVGVGYVGESLLQQFGKVFDAIGYDISKQRIAALQTKYLDHDKIRLTTDDSMLQKGTHFLLAVPTPLRDDYSVNLSYVTSAMDLVIARARPASCIVIESSVPVGTTRQLLGPYQSVFSCGMSPERIDPGRAFPMADQIPKVVSGLTPDATKHIATLYGSVYETLVSVSKPEVAEMTKLHENCYRMVNIAYANEMSDACLSHGIDPQEMIQAASTKPFGFQPFYPGLGVGGHCLPVNPWYLFHNNKKLKVLTLATKLMADRPRAQAKRFHRKCQDLDRAGGTPMQGPRVLVVGLGFKKGQSNLTHAPALSFAKKLAELGCERLAFYDPTIAKEEVEWMEKLGDLYWTSSYVDSKFDGVAWCNRLESIDTAIFQNLRTAVFKKFVW